jgi:hypothetical protein
MYAPNSKAVVSVERLGYSHSNDPVEITRFQADAADAIRELLTLVQLMGAAHDSLVREVHSLTDDMEDVTEGYETIKQDSEYVFNQVEDILQAKRGSPGKMGPAGPPGPSGPIADITKHPLYLEQVDRIKDLEDRIEELAEALDALED